MLQCTVVTMYYGVEEQHASMPSWSKWVVLCFGGWRLLADVLLTSANLCSGISCVCLLMEYQTYCFLKAVKIHAS